MVRIPYDHETLVLARDFVALKRSYLERVTSSEVLHKLIETNIRNVLMNNDGSLNVSDWKAALRCTQQWLAKNGFQRGKRRGCVKMNPEHVERRDQYLKAILTNRSKPVGQRRKEIYTDESYIHYHHRGEKDVLHHLPNPKESKAPHKGKRFCFIAVIEYDPNTDESKLIPNLYWAFCPTMKEGHTGDYHKVFDSSNYFKLFH